MSIIAKRALREFWEAPKYTDAKGPLQAWHAGAKKAIWATPHDIKGQYHNASIIKGNRAVFNVGGNKYRVVAAIDYTRQIVFIRFVGTHRQYDLIDVETI